MLFPYPIQTGHVGGRGDGDDAQRATLDAAAVRDLFRAPLGGQDEGIDHALLVAVDGGALAGSVAEDRLRFGNTGVVRPLVVEVELGREEGERGEERGHEA